MTENNRILGLDYGSKTVGVAISDPLLLTAQGLEIIRREKPTKLRRTIARIGQIIDEYHVNRIVVGLPKNMDSSMGFAAQRSLNFKELIEKNIDIEVVLEDERLTSVMAHNILSDNGKKMVHHKKVVDEIAATLILEDYLKKV